MITREQLRPNCPTCPPGITFFENGIPILELDLHGTHQRGDEDNCYIVRWRVKKETPFINMQRYEEEVLTGYYTDELQEPSLTQKPHRVEATYNYKIEGEMGHRSKQLNFFLLFGRSMGSALDM